MVCPNSNWAFRVMEPGDLDPWLEKVCDCYSENNNMTSHMSRNRPSPFSTGHADHLGVTLSRVCDNFQGVWVPVVRLILHTNSCMSIPSHIHNILFFFYLRRSLGRSWCVSWVYVKGPVIRPKILRYSPRSSIWKQLTRKYCFKKNTGTLEREQTFSR